MRTVVSNRNCGRNADLPVWRRFYFLALVRAASWSQLVFENTVHVLFLYLAFVKVLDFFCKLQSLSLLDNNF